MSINKKLKCTAFGCSSLFNKNTGFVFSDNERACDVCVGKYWEWKTNYTAKCKNCNCLYELHFDKECVCSRCPGFDSSVVAFLPTEKISNKQRKRLAREERKKQKRLESASKFKKLEELESLKVEPKKIGNSEISFSIQEFVITNAGKRVKVFSDDKVIDNTIARIIGWQDDMIVIECEKESNNEILDITTINTVVEDFVSRITDEKNGTISTYILGKFVFQEEIGIAELTWNGDFYSWESL